MNELQQKIEAAEKKKAKIDTPELASIKEKLFEDANVGIKQAKNACALQKEANKL